MSSDSNGEHHLPTLPRRPGIVLSPRGLTWLFGIVLFIPLVMLVIISMTLPRAHDLPLDVSATLIRDPQAPPVLRVVSQCQSTIQALRVELNGAYAYFPQSPLPPGESLDLSLTWFMKKTGSRLDPEQTPIRTVHISGRLPGNQRAVYQTTVTDSSELTER